METCEFQVLLHLGCSVQHVLSSDHFIHDCGAEAVLYFKSVSWSLLLIAMMIDISIDVNRIEHCLSSTIMNEMIRRSNWMLLWHCDSSADFHKKARSESRAFSKVQLGESANVATIFYGHTQPLQANAWGATWFITRIWKNPAAVLPAAMVSRDWNNH